MTHYHSVSKPTKIKPSPVSWASLFIIQVLNEMFTGLFFIAQPRKKNQLICDRTGENKAGLGLHSKRESLVEFSSLPSCVGVSWQHTHRWPMILLVAATSEISDPQDIFWRMVPYSLGQQNVSAGVEGGL